MDIMMLNEKETTITYENAKWMIIICANDYKVRYYHCAKSLPCHCRLCWMSRGRQSNVWGYYYHYSEFKYQRAISSFQLHVHYATRKPIISRKRHWKTREFVCRVPQVLPCWYLRPPSLRVQPDVREKALVSNFWTRRRWTLSRKATIQTRHFRTQFPTLTTMLSVLILHIGHKCRRTSFSRRVYYSDMATILFIRLSPYTATLLLEIRTSIDVYHALESCSETTTSAGYLN